jgi:hypothetical protein
MGSIQTWFNFNFVAMFNTLSNYLLMILIGLIAYIGKVIYEKIEKLIDEIRQIMISDMSNKKDIETLKNITSNHEERISKLEN